MATGLCGTCGGSTPGCGCHVTAGSGIAVTGDGSSGSPFVLTATVGRVTAGTRVTVSGAGSVASPYVVNADATVVSGGSGADVSGSGTSGSPFLVAVRNRLALPNPIRNASGAICQRGATVTPAAAAFGIDGWINYYRADIVYSRQLSGDTQGSGYCIRVQRPAANAVTTATGIAQSCLTADSVRFGGRQTTMSIRVRKGATAASNMLSALTAYTGTGTDQSVGGGFTGSATNAATVPALTTSWQTVPVTFTAGASVTQLGAFLTLAWAGTAGASDYIEFKDVRFDEGPYALEHVEPDEATQLIRCQRLFWRCGGSHAYEPMGNGTGISTTSAAAWITPPVPMRAAPTPTYPTASLLMLSDASANTALTAITTTTMTARIVQVALTTASGLAQYRPYELCANNSTSGFIDFSAEI